MSEDRENWLSETEVAYLNNPAEIDARHRSTYENRLEAKANEPFLHLLNHLPELVEYVSPTSKERVQKRVDPFYLGRGFAKLFSRNQLLRMAAGFVWTDQPPEEADQDFLTRVPELIEAFSDDLQLLGTNVEHNFGMSDFLNRVTETILDNFEQEIESKRIETDVDMAVPAHRVAEWAATHETSADAPILRQLLSELYATSPEEFYEGLQTCRTLLINAGEKSDVSTPREGENTGLEERWAFHLPPREGDLKQYTAAIDGLNDEIATVVDAYWDHHSVIQRDQLVSEALAVREDLESRDEQILDREDRTNTCGGWTRYDTRRANVLTDNYDPALLTRDAKADNRKEWKLTAFGDFVNWLRKEDITQADIKRDGFPPDTPDQVVKAALNQLRNATHG